MLALATLTLVLSALIGLAFPMVVRYLLDAAFIRQDRAILDRIAIGLLLLGLPDRFVDHGDPGRLLASVGLDAEGIRKSITAVMSD
jgi:hypothetical protein